MEFKAKDIAALLSGVVDGDPEISVNNVSKIEEGKPGTLAFLANPKYEHYIYTTQASIVLVNKTFEPTHEYSCTLIRVESAYDAIATAMTKVLGGTNISDALQEAEEAVSEELTEE